MRLTLYDRNRAQRAAVKLSIVRDVWITVTGPIEVNRQQIRTQVKDGQARISDQITVENHFPQQNSCMFSVRVFDPEGNATAHESRKVDVAPGIARITISTTV